MSKQFVMYICAINTNSFSHGTGGRVRTSLIGWWQHGRSKCEFALWLKKKLLQDNNAVSVVEFGS